MQLAVDRNSALRFVSYFRYVDAYTAGSYNMVTREKQDNDSQLWVIAPFVSKLPQNGIYTIKQQVGHFPRPHASVIGNHR